MAGRTSRWDTELGRLLWLDGKTDAQIAEELGTSQKAVELYRQRHWQKGQQKPETKPEPAPHQPEGKPIIQQLAAPAVEREPVKPEPFSMSTPDGVYRILEEATKTKAGIEAICTADAILCLWNWDSADDLRRARAAINHLIKRLEG